MLLTISHTESVKLRIFRGWRLIFKPVWRTKKLFSISFKTSNRATSKETHEFEETVPAMFV